MVIGKQGGIGTGETLYPVASGVDDVQQSGEVRSAGQVGDVSSTAIAKERLATAKQALDISIEQFAATVLMPAVGPNGDTALASALREDPAHASALIRAVAASLRTNSVKMVQDLIHSVKNAA
jgi:hypothetical protein